jgi:ribosomal protein S18 acetylase RimI-like enzyme
MQAEEHGLGGGRQRKQPRDLVVRRATAEDGPQIEEIYAASWRATYVNELPAGFLHGKGLAAEAARWRRRIAEGIDVLVAEEAGNVIGHVTCGPAHDAVSQDSGEWEIHSLHVAPAHYRLGVGSALFSGAARVGRERGARELVLWVVRTNVRARAFYEREGMRHDGGEQDHNVGCGQVLHEVHYRMGLYA